jgi:hypothetical protein
MQFLALGLKIILDADKEEQEIQSTQYKPSSWKGRESRKKENAQSSDAPTLTQLLCKS